MQLTEKLKESQALNKLLFTKKTKKKQSKSVFFMKVTQGPQKKVNCQPLAISIALQS